MRMKLGSFVGSTVPRNNRKQLTLNFNWFLVKLPKCELNQSNGSKYLRGNRKVQRNELTLMCNERMKMSGLLRSSMNIFKNCPKVAFAKALQNSHIVVQQPELKPVWPAMKRTTTVTIFIQSGSETAHRSLKPCFPQLVFASVQF
jgi:hypothetical protein